MEISCDSENKNKKVLIPWSGFTLWIFSQSQFSAKGIWWAPDLYHLCLKIKLKVYLHVLMNNTESSSVCCWGILLPQSFRTAPVHSWILHSAGRMFVFFPKLICVFVIRRWWECWLGFSNRQITKWTKLETEVAAYSMSQLSHIL